MKLLYVEWLDAESSAEWKDTEEMEEWAKEQVIVKEVGWEYKRTKFFLILCSQFGKNEEWGNTTKIPLGMIKKQKVLKMKR